MNFLSDLFNKKTKGVHTWKIHTTTRDALDSLYAACESAKHSIYLETYLFTPDSLGEKFLTLFKKKEKEGVKVRLLVDSVGSIGLGSSVLLEILQKTGVRIKFFNWLLPFSKHNKRIWYFRNHRRIVLIDKETLFTGGFCINNKMDTWRDTTLEIKGPVVDQAVKVAETTWKKVYKKRFINLGKEWRTNLGGFSFVTHAPLPGERFLYRSIVEAIRQAKSYIYLTTPYFVPDHRITRVLKLAAKRGVDVRILIPKKCNYPVVDHAAHTYFHGLLSKGVRIFLYKDMIHAKTVVIDDEWATIGTLNMDNVSLRYNFECGVVTTDSGCAKKLREIFEHDQTHTSEVNLHAWEKRPFLEKFKDAAVWPIRKLL